MQGQEYLQKFAGEYQLRVGLLRAGDGVAWQKQRLPPSVKIFDRLPQGLAWHQGAGIAEEVDLANQGLGP